MTKYRASKKSPLGFIKTKVFEEEFNSKEEALDFLTSIFGEMELKYGKSEYKQKGCIGPMLPYFLIRKYNKN